MSLEGVEGTKEKRAKIVTYVANNLRRWQPSGRDVYKLFLDVLFQPQHLRLQVHPLRAVELGERAWSDVADGRLLQWPVYNLWPWGEVVLKEFLKPLETL